MSLFVAKIPDPALVCGNLCGIWYVLMVVVAAALLVVVVVVVPATVSFVSS